MNKYTYADLKNIVSKIKITLEGKRINKFQELSKYDFIIIPSGKVESLLLSLSGQNPFVDLFPVEDSPKNYVNDSRFFLNLRRHINNAIIQEVNLIISTKSMYFKLLVNNDNYTVSTYFLYAELLKTRPNLILCDDSNKIIDALHQSKTLDVKRIIKQNFSYERLAQYDFSKEEQTATGSSFATEYLISSAKTRQRSNNATLYKVIKNLSDKSQKKLDRLSLELLDSQKADGLIMQANLLMTYQPSINTPIIELDGVSINVDPTLNYIKNANALFSQAKKSKRALTHINEQIKITRENLSYLNNTYQQLDLLSNEDIVSVNKEFSKNFTTAKDSKPSSFDKPYFFVFNGVKIGFGKNNTQNDYLTHKVATKNDLFLHVKERPGAHMVIFSSSISNEIISYAANALLSICKIIDGEIILTQVKNVKKGNYPGQVIIKQYQSIFKRIDPTFDFKEIEIKRQK